MNYFKKISVLFKGTFSFLIFFVSSQFFTLLIPFPSKLKNRSSGSFYTMLLQKYAVFIYSTHLNIKVHHINRKKSTFSKPVLVVCNHQSIIDVPISVAFSPDMCIINNNWHNNIWAKIFIEKYVRFFPIDMGKEALVEKLKPSVIKNCPILIFPEGVMKTNQKIGRFHKGGFYLANEIGIDIQPVVIVYSRTTLKKNWFFFKHGHVFIKYLDVVKYGSSQYGNSYQELTLNVNLLMRKEYELMHREFSKQI